MANGVEWLMIGKLGNTGYSAIANCGAYGQSAAQHSCQGPAEFLTSPLQLRTDAVPSVRVGGCGNQPANSDHPVNHRSHDPFRCSDSCPIETPAFKPSESTLRHITMRLCYLNYARTTIGTVPRQSDCFIASRKLTDGNGVPVSRSVLACHCPESICVTRKFGLQKFHGISRPENATLYRQSGILITSTIAHKKFTYVTLKSLQAPTI